MKRAFSERIEELLRNHDRRRLLKWTGCVLGCAVAIGIAWWLMLPALTLGQRPQCGLEEHTHSQDCYTDVTTRQCICTPQSLGVHQHTQECYDQNGECICGYADFVLHTHDAGCYDASGKLICTLPEVKEHVHTDECYETRQVLICGKEETEGHVHTEACRGKVRGDLICGQEECPAHHHTEACKGKVRGELICGQEECPAHHHGPECYEKVRGELICGEQERPGHHHTEECYRTERVLICTEDHEHTDACYAEEKVLICGLQEDPGHTHTDACYAWTEKLTCGKEETEGHTHTDECYQWVDGYICGKEETEGHTHTDECYQWVDGYVCGLEEQEPHVHTEECYGEERVLLCEKPEIQAHIHDETCYDAEGNLICGKPEICTHVHEESCFSQTTEHTLTCGKQEHTHGDGCYLPEEQQTLVCVTDTATVSVSGLLPVGAEVRAVPVEIAIEDQEVVMAFDISIVMPDGSTFEPAEGNLTVEITAPEIENEDCEIYYVPDSGEPETVPAETAEGGLTFDTPHFSVYAVTRGLPQPKLLDGGPMTDKDGVEVPNMTWSYIEEVDGTHTLKIEGKGDMPSFAGAYSLTPYHKYHMTTDKIVLGENITSAGNSCFYYSRAQEIVFPSSLVLIDSYAFHGNGRIQKLVIPGTVKKVMNWAFSVCSNLEEIILEEGVETIAGSAFLNSGGGSVLRLPASLVDVGSSLSSGIFSAYEVADGNQKFMSEDGVLYERLKDGTRRLVAYPNQKQGKYTVPADVSSVQIEAFYGSDGLLSIVVPPTVKTLEYGAFSRSGLQEIYVCDGVSTNNSSAMFQFSENLRKVRIPADFGISGSSLFRDCVSLEKGYVPQNISRQELMFYNCPSLREIVYDAKESPKETGVFSNTTDGLTLVIGRNVDVLRPGFSEFASHAANGQILFAPNNQLHIEAGALEGGPGEFPGISGDFYVDSQGAAYTYDAEAGTAILGYVPRTVPEVDYSIGEAIYHSLTALTVPKTIEPLPGVICNVTGVAKGALKFSRLKTMEFAAPDQVTLASYALADCPSLVKINDQTTLEGAEALFGKTGSNALYNTGLIGASSPESFAQNMDGVPMQTATLENAPEMNITVKSGTWKSSSAEMPDTGGYHLLTGETLSVTATMGNTDAASDFVYRIYIQTTAADCNVGLSPGEYEYQGQKVSCYATEDANTLCMEFTPGKGNTISIPLDPNYPSPTSRGGGVIIWGVILKPEDVEAGNIRGIVPSENKIQASWTTKPDDFILEKIGSQDVMQVSSRKVADAVIIRPVDNLNWNIKFNRRSLDASSFGKDYVRSVDFEDRIILPEEFIWDPDFIAALKADELSLQNGEFSLNGSRLLSLTKTTALTGLRLEYDEDTQGPVLHWGWRNLDLKTEINAMDLTFVLAPDAILLKENQVFGSDMQVKIHNQVSGIAHYTHSADQSLQAEGENTIQGNLGKLEIRKNSTEIKHFGDVLDYTVDVFNSGTMPWYGETGKTYLVEDTLQAQGYVSPANMLRMFEEAETLGTDLEIKISKAQRAPFEPVTGVDGITTCYRTVRNSDLGSRECTILLKRDSADSYTAKVGNESFTGTTPAQALQAAGFDSVYHARYYFYWDLGTGRDAVFQTAEGKTFHVYANVKDSFLLLPGDKETEYPRDSTVTFDNRASLVTAKDGVLEPDVIDTDFARNTARRDAMIHKALFVNGVDVTGKPRAENGDILDYRLQFDHYGTGAYHDLPMVDTIAGTQILLVPAQSNPQLAGEGLKTTDREGVRFYQLSPGTYRNVIVGVDEQGKTLNADTVTVTDLGGTSGWNTTIKWYFPDLPGEKYTKTIDYQVLMDTALSGGATWRIDNTVWVNDKPDRRIFATIWAGGTEIGFNKDLVTTRGATPEQDILDDDDFCGVERGDRITYRLKFSNPLDISCSISGKHFCDELPSTFGAFEWEKDVNVELETVSLQGNAKVTDLDQWTLGTTPPELIDQGNQFILWPDTARISFEGRGSVYLYITLTFPDNREAEATWTNYAKAADGVIIENVLYSYGFPSAVSHELKEPGKVLLQKGVYAMSSTSSQGWMIDEDGSRQYYNNKDARGRAVTYYAAVYNGGISRMYLGEIHDTLPKGFKFERLQQSPQTPRNGDSSVINYWGGMTGIEFPPGTRNVSVKITASQGPLQSDGSRSLVFKASSGNGPNPLGFDEKQQLYYLDPGEMLSFSYLAVIGLSAETENVAVNTVGMKYIDRLNAGVNPVEDDFRIRAEVPQEGAIDSNDGTFQIVDGAQASGYGFPAKRGEQWLVSEVKQRRGDIIPGVTKFTDSYSEASGEGGGSTKVPYKNQAPQNADIHWRVKCTNGGTRSLTDYVLRDAMPAPYVFTGKVSAELYTRGDYLLQNKEYFEILNIRQDESQEIVTIKVGETGFNEKGQMQLTVGGDKIQLHSSQMVNKEYPLAAEIGFLRDNQNNLCVELRIADPQMSIPEAGGYLNLFVTGHNPSGIYKNAVFTNKAVLTPKVQKFTKVNAGSGVVDDSGELTAVTSSAPVTIAFGYATASDKHVTEVDHPENTVQSLLGSDYILLHSPDSIFRYTLHVENSTKKPMTKLVIIDNQPEPGDFSPFDAGAPRNSEFRVHFVPGTAMKVSVIHEDKQVTVLTPDQYRIDYCSNTDFGGPQSPSWRGEDGERWQASPAGAKAFRVIIEDDTGTLIPPMSMVSVEFEAQADPSAQPGQTAWNSFGYHYALKDVSQELEAMPAPVGVKIPSQPVLEKKLVNAEGAELTAREDERFTFRITDGPASRDVNIQVTRGTGKASLILDRSVMGDGWTWQTGRDYTIQEIGLQDRPQWKPGWSTGNADAEGVLTFQYDPGQVLTLSAENRQQVWKLELQKVDFGHRDKMLDGAVFGLYSPAQADAMAEDAYNALPLQPEETVTCQDSTWYLMDVKTTAQGLITWEDLVHSSYCILELKAPDGYRLEHTPIPVSHTGPDVAITVTNPAGFALPRTGGMGRGPGYLLALLLMAAPLTVWICKKHSRKRGL